MKPASSDRFRRSIKDRSFVPDPPDFLEAFALQALALHLACAADGLCRLAGAALGRLLVMAAELHLAEDAFALHLLLERLERLVDIVVTNKNLHCAVNSWLIVRPPSPDRIGSFGFRHSKTVARTSVPAACLKEAGAIARCLAVAQTLYRPHLLCPHIHMTGARMALLKIARMGHPVLLAVAQPVADPKAASVRQLVDDMIETMHDARGAGLAAPQVHVGLRLFVYRVPAERSAGPE